MKNNRIFARIGTAVLLLFACFYMYDFYKCLSGFIANGFREPLTMLPMILAFFLPVLCFFFFFYDFYVRAHRPTLRIGYSVFVAFYAACVLALIFSRFDVYASNNALGVYDSLPGIILHFPYDITLVLISLFAIQLLKFRSTFKKPSRAALFYGNFKTRGSVALGKGEYVALSVMAVFVFIFTGSGITAAFCAFDNAFYDLRYVFLLIWVGLVPMMNLLILALRPDKMKLKKCTRISALAVGIGINLAFGVGLWVLELTQPDFIVHVGKPMFLIAFSVSMPVEPAIILIISAIGTALMLARLISTARRPQEEL